MRILDFIRNIIDPATPEQANQSKARAGVAKQDFLSFTEGNSDKVYHLAMREEGEGLYIVYFEYGRRGAALQSGVKTPAPVGLAAAEKVYAGLLNEKIKKGYQSYPGPEDQVTRSYKKKDVAARNSAIIAHLALAVQDPKKQASKNWRLSRVVWRAGELRLPEALPHLAALLQQPAAENPALMRYCTLWAIARCGAAADSSLQAAAWPVLLSLLQTKPNSIATGPLYYACAAVAPAAERAALRENLIDQLPPSFQHQVRQNQGEQLRQTLQDYVDNRPKSHFYFVETLYALAADQPAIRPAIEWFARNAPFRPGFFQILRRIAKMAEMRADPGLFGIISQRFVLEMATFSARPAGRTAYMDMGGKLESVDQRAELAKPDSRLAFSNKTRQWFIRRTLEALTNALAHNDHSYVKMAVGILLAFDDTLHTSHERSESRYCHNEKTGRWERKITIFPPYSEFTAFFYILHGANSRYTLRKNRTQWTIPEAAYQKLQQESPVQYYEPHTDRWDACPQAYIHLLAESKSVSVQAFALRRFEAHPLRDELTARFDTPLLIQLLGKAHLPAALFALQLAEARFDPQQPDRALVLYMLENQHQPVCQKGHEWLQANLKAFVSDTEFVFQLLTHNVPVVRAQIRQSMPDIAAALTTEQQQALMGRIVVRLLSPEPLADAAELMANLQTWADPHLQRLSISLLMQFIEHPVEATALFGAQLIAQHAPETLPNDALQALLTAKTPEIRACGADIIAKMSVQLLARRTGLLLENFTNQHADVRTSVRAAAAKVINTDRVVGEQALGICLRILLRKEPFEGLHEAIRIFVEADLAALLPAIERKTIFRLLNSEQVTANNLAARLIGQFVDAESLSVRNIVRLGDHEVASVRQICQRMFAENVARMRYEREDALRLLESEWDDTRAFAFAYFRQEFAEREWTPELVIGVCDSVRPDVQAFGRELTERYLRDEDGPEYLLRLSQHPKPEMQAFAAQYLEKYAANNLERLEQLTPYCLTVLSQVNKSRKAKDMVFDFLAREAKKSAEAARIVTNIVNRISLTSVATDKERCIELSLSLE